MTVRAGETLVRPARREDLPAAAAIYGVNEGELAPRIHPLLGYSGEGAAEAALTDLQEFFDDDPGQVWMAESGAAIVGFAAAAFRGRHAHIGYVHVVPQAQGHGIGRDLLGAIRDAGWAAGCTVFTLQASDDPRALTRYFRFGLFPQTPNVIWTASDPRFSAPDLGNHLEPRPIHLEDVATLNTVDDIDKAVRGARRRQDIERWLRECASGALLLDRRSGTPSGYYLVSGASGSGCFGPVAAMDEERFGDVFANALWAAAGHHTTGQVWNLIVPGENRVVVAPLLSAGFRPSYATTFFASEPIGRFDRYVFHDLDLL